MGSICFIRKSKIRINGIIRTARVKGGIFIARKTRIWYPGAIYHIMNRGCRHQKIYQDDSDYQFFLMLLSSIKNKLPFFLHAYCLMTNHYHLLIETNEAEIWKIMKPLNQNYTEYYNHKYGYDGPLFRGRYKACLVKDDAYFLENSRYIHLNPVKAKMASAAEFYPWSSYKSLIGMEHQTIVDEGQTLKYFKGDSNLRYRNFVENAINGMYEEKIRTEVGEDELWLPW